MEELLKALIDIQQNLNAPKGQYNNFGKFNYRSLEDIEAAIKPFLAKHSCGIRFSDEIEDHCNRTFVKTTLTFFNCKGDSISTTAVAENVSEKSGMDGAQITGAASSYARKYAMNALFAIDDTKDADTNQYHDQTAQATPKPTTTRRAKTVTATTSPQTAQPADRFAAIRNAINAVPDVDALLSLYQQHRNEVENTPEIKKLFSERKQQLKQLKDAA
jgi:hypothetical protein